MKIAIVNLITKTVDMPRKKSSILGLSPDGIESDEDANIMEHASNMGALGNDVTVFVSDTYRPRNVWTESNERVKVEYLPTKLKTVFPPAYIPFTPQLESEILSGRFDVVQSGELFQWGTVLASRATRKNKMPLIVWQEIDINPRFPGGIVQATYNGTYGRIVDRRVATYVPRSKSAMNYLAAIGIGKNRVSSVIHTGVNTGIFHPLEDGNLKDEFGFKSETPLAVAVGRLHSNKGFDFLIRVIAKARQRVPNVSLIIKGSGPQKAELIELIEELHLEKNVVILSEHLSREAMNHLYAAADFTTISSRVDLFPFSAIETLACGKPIISSFGRAIELDVIGDHSTGILVPDGSVDSFADAIVYLVRNREVRKEMGRNALRLCQEQFDMDVICRQFHSLYSRMVGSGFSA
jgi:glycosyltransferase involved in cell wall biosynthesis